MPGLQKDDLGGVEVRRDAEVRERYSRDRSPFVVEPQAVALPHDAAGVAACVAGAAAAGVPVTARAGGSSVAGQCLGSGLIVDTSLLGGVEVDGPDSCWVGAGVTLDDLNAGLSSAGRMIGPDATSSQWARVGGLVGTNACGSRSLVHGRMGDALLAAEVVRANGSVEALSPCGSAWPSLRAVLDGLEKEVSAAWPRQHRGFGGYALDAFARRGDPLSLVPGSEGTLCVVTRARFATVPCWRSRTVSRAAFGSLREALDAAPSCAASGASAVEVLDSHLTGGDPVLLVEHLDRPDGPGALPSSFALLSDSEADAAWSMRRDALARLEAGGVSAVSLFEDPAVVPERAGEFAAALLSLLARFDLDAVVYGHAAAGCLHVRPLVDPSLPGLEERLLAALEEVFALVASFGGAVTGEHGWGLARSHLAPRALGPELYARCVAVKEAWDPDGVLNPGRIVGGEPPAVGTMRLG
jgi:FAD/FMN-containing dehydrogenase